MKSILDLPPRIDGGDAFPHEAGLGNAGMTLRDYFAAQAMQAICAAKFPAEFIYADRDWFQEASQKAFAAADAMLEARKR